MIKLAILLLLFFNSALGQKITLDNSEVVFFKSQVNNVKYKLYISLPYSYFQGPKKSYPIIYSLDPDLKFPIISGTAHYIGGNLIPEVIIVGIGYADNNINNYIGYESDAPSPFKINRGRDYIPASNDPSIKSLSPTYTTYNTGKAEDFIKVIQKEVMPLIEKSYRVTPNKTLLGHSYGGLFTVWAFLNYNSMFDNYIALSPSLWYQGNWISRQNFERNITDRKNSRLYISFGADEDTDIKEGFAKFKIIDARLKRIYKKNYKVEIMQGEQHGTVFISTLSRSLRFTVGKK